MVTYRIPPTFAIERVGRTFLRLLWFPLISVAEGTYLSLEETGTVWF